MASATVETESKSLKSMLKRRHEAETPEERKLLAKINWRIIPILGLLYGLIFLNRYNVSLIETYGLDEGTNTTSILRNTTGYTDQNKIKLQGIVFQTGYAPIEFVSNMALLHFEPRIWLFVTMAMTGILSAVSGAVKTFDAFLVIRFFLGLFEGAFFPGAIYLMSRWYRREYLGLPVSIFFSGSAVLAAFGNLIAAGIVKIPGNLQGWQYVAIIEGCMTFVLIFCSLWLPNPVEISDRVLQEEPRQSEDGNVSEEDKPGSISLQVISQISVNRSNERDDASEGPTAKGAFFSADEKEVFDRWMTRDGDHWRAVPESQRARSIKEYWTRALSDWKKLLMFMIMRIGSVLPRDLIHNLIPSIIKDLEFTNGMSGSEKILLSVPPLFLGFLFSILAGWISDVTRKRSFVNIGCSMLSMIGGIILIVTKDPIAQYIAACLVCMGSFATAGHGSTWVCNNIEGYSKRAIVLGITVGTNNTVSISTSGLSGKDTARSALIIGFSGLCIIISYILHLYLKEENRKKLYDKDHGYQRWDPKANLPEEQGDLSPEFLYFD